MGRLPDNYFGPKERITKLKADYPKDQSAILTESTAFIVGEALCILIKATIQINGKTVAQGQAFTDCPEDDKAVEKTETVAIGRALVNAGYPETSDGEDLPEEEVKEEKPKKSGLGKAKKEKEDVEETEESDSEDSGEEEAKPKKSKGGLGKLGSKSSSTDKGGSTKDQSDDESEDDEKEDSSEEKEDAKEEVQAKKLSREELLAKYRKPQK